jgi:hypothetical protein
VYAPRKPGSAETRDVLEGARQSRGAAIGAVGYLAKQKVRGRQD